MSERQFTDREFALILKRAASLQSKEDEPRHRLADLQDIASQVGIPLELVARVVEEFDADSRSAFWGPSTSMYSSASTPVYLTAEAHADLLTAIRRIARDPGNVTLLSNGFEWRQNSGYSTLTVSVSSDGTQTSVRVEAEHEGTRFMTFFLPLLAAGLGALLTGVEQGVGIGLAVSGGGVAAAFLTGRVLWQRIARKSRSTAAAVQQAVIGLIESSRDAR